MNIVIIEDDDLFCETLESVIIDYFPEVKIVGKATNVKDGIELIKSTKPDLILLDINLPDGTGFDILENTKDLSFSIIYITAFIEYAEESYNYPALHFISKANMSYEKLKTAFDRYLQTKSNDNIDEGINLAKEKLYGIKEKLIVKLKDNEIHVDTEQIVMFEAQINYTILILKKSSPIKSSKTLLSYEFELNPQYFVRVHKKYIININSIKKYNRNLTHTIHLEDGTILTIGRKYKKNFYLKYLENIQNINSILT